MIGCPECHGLEARCNDLEAVITRLIGPLPALTWARTEDWMENDYTATFDGRWAARVFYNGMHVPTWIIKPDARTDDADHCGRAKSIDDAMNRATRAFAIERVVAVMQHRRN